jgi:putative addiction module CopG family antidote
MSAITIDLPEDLERFIRSEVQRGLFASEVEVITEAVRLLQQRKQEASSQGKAPTPDELNRQLLEAGLLTRVPTRPDPETYREFSPIVVEGEPVSETIIRERRRLGGCSF